MSCAPRASCHDHVFSFQNSPDLVHRSWRRGYETGQFASKGSLLESFISACAFPMRVFRTAFMAWHSRRPLLATVHCVSRSFLTSFTSICVFCQTWDAGCHYSPRVVLSDCGPSSSISTSAEHFTFFRTKFCTIPSQFTVHFLGICTNFVDLAKFCKNVHLARSAHTLRLLQPRAREPQPFRISHI